jgi:hypothetical protein
MSTITTQKAKESVRERASKEHQTNPLNECYNHPAAPHGHKKRESSFFFLKRSALLWPPNRSQKDAHLSRIRARAYPMFGL